MRLVILSMLGKRKNPDYQQICFYLRKELGIKFKTICTAEELEQSEVLEGLVNKWIQEKEHDK